MLFFGMAGQFSRAPLLALLEAGIDVRAVVMPSVARLAGAPPSGTPPITTRAPAGTTSPHGRALPLLGSEVAENIARIAAARGIPVLEVARPGDPETLAVLGAYVPDAICVACFPWRVPRGLLELPRLGCVNLHPSLLPENRGPDPLFWTFRRGDATIGVTAHLMDERLDAGPIVAQRVLPVPEAIDEFALEGRCAEVGGELLAQAVWELARGTARPAPQDEARATTYSWPQEADYVVTPQRPAWWAHRFVTGVSGRGIPIHLEIGERTFKVVESLGYEPEATQVAPWQLSDDLLALRCVSGVWHARVLRDVALDRAR